MRFERDQTTRVDTQRFIIETIDMAGSVDVLKKNSGRSVKIPTHADCRENPCDTIVSEVLNWVSCHPTETPSHPIPAPSDLVSRMMLGLNPFRNAPKTLATATATIAITLSFGLTVHAEDVASSDNVGVATWPQWRGPSQTGTTSANNLPTTWTEADSRKIEIPGTGGSTPVVVGDVAYLTSGVDGKNTLIAVDFDQQKILWQTPLGNDEGNKHRKGSGANPSPVTDGNFVVAYFRSGDLACVDLTGNVVWSINLQTKFGDDTLWWDLGSSPAMARVDGRSIVIVPVMQTGPSYLVAFDIESGEMKWKSDRNTGAPSEAAQSYSTPVVVDINGRTVIAVMGADTLTLNSASDGKEIARLGGFNPDAEQYFRSIASPVADGNVIVCPYSRGNTLTGVDLEKLAASDGDESAAKDAILWHRDGIGSDVPTPAIQNGIVYLISDGKPDSGTVSALDAKSGKTLWQVSLDRNRHGYSSSPLVTSEHIYVTDETAKTSVVGPIGRSDSGNTVEPQVIATNPIADAEIYTVASPIPVGDRLLLRTKHFLYVFGE